MLPFLRMGSKGIEEYQKTVQGLGAVMTDQDVERANQFALSLSKLGLAGQGLKNSIGSALIPAIKPLVDELATWISKNRELIATDIAGYAQDFATWVRSVDWKQVGQDVTDFIKDVGKVIDMLGGWKGAAIAVAVAMNAQLIGSVLSLTATLAKGSIGLLAYIGQLGRAEAAASGLGGALGSVGRAGLYGAALAGGVYAGNKIADGLEGTRVWDMATHYFAKNTGRLLGAVGFKDNTFSRAAHFDGYDQKYNGAASVTSVDPQLAGRVVKYFEQQGWTPAQAQGIAANLMRESALNPNASGDNGKAFGLGQWHADRQANFAAWSGKSIHGAGIQDQLAFVQYELTKGAERAAGDRLRQAQTAQQAGEVVSRYYERPADANGEAAARGALAGQLAAPQGPYTSAGGKPVDGNVHVQIEIPNAPAGTKAKTSANGNTTAAVRIGYSQVGAAA
jgi:hypothetical protein